MTQITTRGADQPLLALERANQARLARAELKRQIASGDLTAAQVILACPEEARCWPVGSLLISQPRWGRRRCQKLLQRNQIAELKPLGDLTERQRRILAGQLGTHTPRRTDRAGAELSRAREPPCRLHAGPTQPQAPARAARRLVLTSGRGSSGVRRGSSFTAKSRATAEGRGQLGDRCQSVSVLPHAVAPLVREDRCQRAASRRTVEQHARIRHRYRRANCDRSRPPHYSGPATAIRPAATPALPASSGHVTFPP